MPIDLNNVSYCIDDNFILNPVSFRIEKKDKVAIIGENGFGKSTLLNILGELYSSYGGSLTISDNTEYTDIVFGDIANTYSFISQKPFVVNGILKENIESRCDIADDQQENKILSKLGLSDIKNREIDSHTLSG